MNQTALASMPSTSRKKLKGKERKAKKSDLTWQQWAIRDKVCNHGCITIPDRSHPVYQCTESLILGTGKRPDLLLVNLIVLLDKQKDILNVESHKNDVVNVLASIATNQLLHQTQHGISAPLMDHTICITQAIFMLDKYYEGSDVESLFYRPDIARKVRDLMLCNEDDGGGSRVRDALKILTCRLPCSCLEEMYSKVRQTPKLAFCSTCGLQSKRRTFMQCGACKVDQYCSKACQVNNWSYHQSHCAAISKWYSQSDWT